ncbi:TolC family protein, partial [Phocaeicola sp.]
YNLSSLYHNKHKTRETQQYINLQKNAEEQLMQDIRVNVRSAYIRHNEALDRVKALLLSVSQAEENYRIVHNRYMNQLSILTDLLDASNIRLQEELQLTTARANVIYTYYQLLRICGNL